MSDYLLNQLPKILNSVGLLCNIAGALLIWKFGLPENINRKGHIHLILSQEDEEEKKKAKKYDRLASFGIFLLLLGFVLQFLVNFL